MNVYALLQLANLDTVRWRKSDAAQIHTGSLQDAGDALGGRPVLGILPGAQVSLSEVMLPARSRQKLLQAIPYSLEDQLIDDVEELHFAIPERKLDASTPVCAVRKDLLNTLVEQCRQAHLQLRWLVPATLALPWQEQDWTLLLENDGATLRTGECAGLHFDAEYTPLFMQRLLASATTRPRRIVVLLAPDVTAAPDLGFLQEQDITLETTEHFDLLSRVDVAALEERAINLLQGAYKPRRIRNEHVRQWYAPAALALVFLAVALVRGLLNYVDLRQESSQLNTSIESLFHQALPDQKRMVNPRAQMEQRLRELQGSGARQGGNFLDLMTKVGPRLKQEASTVVNNINYRNGVLDLEFTIGNLQALDKLKQALVEAGLQTEIRSATAQGQTVTGRLRIQENAS